jgi:hypothetical protein
MLAPAPSLPLAASRAPASVQREAVDSSSGGDKTDENTSQSSPEPKAPPPSLGANELQELARRIYPILKRMLAIERERR